MYITKKTSENINTSIHVKISTFPSKLNHILLHLGIQLINRCLDLDRLFQGGGDVDVVPRVVHPPASAVFEVFVHHLIAADLVCPHLGRHTLKIMGFVDVNALFTLVVGGLPDAVIIALPLVFHGGLVKLITF